MPRCHCLLAIVALCCVAVVGCTADATGDEDGTTSPPAVVTTATAPAATATTSLTSTAPPTTTLTTTAAPTTLKPLDAFGSAEIVIVDADGVERTACVLVAATPEERGQGLSDVTDLAGYDGMLFTWGGEQLEPAFYMYRTLIPLSIAFFEAGGAVRTIADMVPCPETDGSLCPLTFSGGLVTDALEVPAGELPALGIDAGSSLATVGGPCAPA
jgi:uncharacterized protein